MAYIDEKGVFRLCTFDLESMERERIRDQRRGLKKLLNLAEDLKTKYVLWQQHHLQKKISKTYLPAFLKREASKKVVYVKTKVGNFFDDVPRHISQALARRGFCDLFWKNK